MSFFARDRGYSPTNSFVIPGARLSVCFLVDIREVALHHMKRYSQVIGNFLKRPILPVTARSTSVSRGVGPYRAMNFACNFSAGARFRRRGRLLAWFLPFSSISTCKEEETWQKKRSNRLVRCRA